MAFICSLNRIKIEENQQVLAQRERGREKILDYTAEAHDEVKINGSVGRQMNHRYIDKEISHI